MGSPAHVVVCPGAGMGHLVPSLRLASMLAATKTCQLTVVIIRPTLSTAETTHIDTFFKTHPQITLSEFHALPCNTDDPTIDDPFFLQYDAVNRSSPFLVAHLTALSPRPSAVFSDFLLTSGISKPLAEQGIPNFTLMVTSARFFSLMLSLLDGPLIKGKDVILPGVAPILADEPPTIMYQPESGFVRLIIINAPHLRYSKGVLLNTFDHFERDTLSALGSGKIFKDLAPVYPIGPLCPLKMEKCSNTVTWLDEQPDKSVVFVSFGSRVAMAKDQIKELGEGLLRSGIRFLWVVKTSIVDKEDKEDLNNLLGDEFFETTKDRGLVLKNWVNQEQVMEHPSIGGFLTHGGWNTVLEAAQLGIPLLSWSSGFDHRVNSGVIADAGLGIWERRWGRQGESLVKADEIEAKIKHLMTSDELRVSVQKVADEAQIAWQIHGSSSKMFNQIIDVFTNTPLN